MVGGVLVEQSVGEVLPALEANASGIGKVIEAMQNDKTKKEKEFSDWKSKNNIQVVGKADI